ncbi:hypothetical protein HMPREF0495_00317 [Levilactobacillus brevis ATCC 14869 = DSM 20054]|uniref:Uncharacterized protein n=1 Tax=Levilactobacillus brevis ATCC 14869 = DSM 20054 TaxID=649758 RepID=U2P4J5_LEVBR|nr:hypothetical protein HMPREF0495_00317 [Levilactobacillus brevis ATCC 14869 = DSM 20054]
MVKSYFLIEVAFLYIRYAFARSIANLPIALSITDTPNSIAVMVHLSAWPIRAILPPPLIQVEKV